MNNNEKLVFAQSLAETFTETELKDMRKKALTTGFNGKVTSWSDIGLSSSLSYDFNIITAVDILTAAIQILNGNCMNRGNCNGRIKKFVL
jgi:hypothetical protein